MFTFPYFLSVLSAIRNLKPQRVFLHSAREPTVDMWLYNTWLEELRELYPFIKSVHNREACNGTNPDKGFITRTLQKHGGIYIDNSILILNLTMGEKDSPPGIFRVDKYSKGMAVLGITKHIRQKMEAAELRWPENHTVDRCPSTQEVNKYSELPVRVNCVQMTSEFTPSVLLDEERDSNFNALARQVFYGAKTIPKPVRHEDPVIPNIAHFVWLGGGEMDFLFYLSVLSLLHIVKVDAVNIHGDRPPAGELWRNISGDPRVQFVRHDRIKKAGKGMIPVKKIEHQADLLMHTLMYTQGGIFLEYDSLFIQSIPEDFYHYDAVASLDNYVFPMPPFPDVLSLGVSMHRPRSEFLEIYRKSEALAPWRDNDYVWNCNRVPYKIYERNPHVISINATLQVICYDLKCYPTWIPSYRRQQSIKLSKNPEEWVDRVLAFHWTAPNPKEFINMSQLHRMNSTFFGKLGQKVLQAANLW